MTLLLLLRPRFDMHDPGATQAYIDTIKKRSIKKAKRRVAKETQSLDLIKESDPIKRLKSAREPTSFQKEARALEAQITNLVKIREKLFTIRDTLEKEAFNKRMRRVALQEIGIRQEIARLLQEEEDEAIMLFLWDLIQD